jgi:hypothetical protein
VALKPFAPPGASEAELRALARCAKLIESEISFPELKPVETDQNGLSQGCGSEVRHKRSGKLARAANQIRCFVAAAARRQKTQHKPAAVRTIKLSISTATSAPT